MCIICQLFLSSRVLGLFAFQNNDGPFFSASADLSYSVIRFSNSEITDQGYFKVQKTWLNCPRVKFLVLYMVYYILHIFCFVLGFCLFLGILLLVLGLLLLGFLWVFFVRQGVYLLYVKAQIKFLILAVLSRKGKCLHVILVFSLIFYNIY